MTHTNAYAGNTYRLPKTAEEAAEICSSGVYEPGVAIGVVCIIFKILVAGTVLPGRLRGISQADRIRWQTASNARAANGVTALRSVVGTINNVR
jgi:hypothetical protein|tara:strand:- start:22381 stop:22662 length:282 start_codon:yes stop_codon:yes gene_type:complete